MVDMVKIIMELIDVASALEEENKQLEKINEIYLDALENIVSFSLIHSYQWAEASNAIQSARDRRWNKCPND